MEELIPARDMKIKLLEHTKNALGEAHWSPDVAQAVQGAFECGLVLGQGHESSDVEQGTQASMMED